MSNFLNMHRFQKLVIYLVFVFLNFEIYSQQLSSILKVAEQSMASKNYYDAYKKYLEALEFEPNNNNFRYQAAIAGIQFGAYKQSGDLLQLILDSEEKNLFPETALKLGQMRQIQGHYEQAILAYTIFKTEYSVDSSPNYKIAEREIRACQWAIKQLQNPNKEVKIWRLENHINSSFSDFAPYAIGDSLYYSSLRFENLIQKEFPKKHVASILRSINNDLPIKILTDSFPGLGKSLAHSSYSHKKDIVFFTVCEDLNDYDKRCDIYKSTVNLDGLWSDPVKLPEYINAVGYSTTQPCYIDPYEGNPARLFFSSNRPANSKGGFDIWYCDIDENGTYSEPVNCTDINTSEDEFSPYYYQKGKTLYFSSKGHLGFGGLDIFKSKNTTKGFSIPVNLGSPQNSSFDDVYYYIHPQDTIAFMASNRTGTLFLDDASEACCLDLFRLSIASCDISLISQVFNFYSQEPILGASVQLIDLDDDSAVPIEITNLNSHTFPFNIICERNYKIIASKNGYTSDSVQFNSGQPGEFKSIVKKLFLKPAKVDLELLTFNRNNGDTLNGVTLHILDLDGSLDTILFDPNNNRYVIPAIPCHRYHVTAFKHEFAPADSTFIIDCGITGTVQKKIYLPTIIFSYLPLSLYFDNDKPNTNSWDTFTKSLYSTTFKTYYAKQNEFIKVNQELQQFDQKSPDDSMKEFFEKRIKYGKERLDSFMIILEKDLKRGKKYEIFLKGYASPLAKSNYNLNLSNRRIHSVYNEILAYKNGILKKYIKNGQLKLSRKPFGESSAPTGISDQKKDLRSVYSIEASQERRVEIIEIKE